MPSAIGKISWPAKTSALSALTREFQEAKPFPHVVIDGFLPRPLCAALDSEFPPYDIERFRNEFGHAGKAVYPRVRELGPAFRALDDLVQTPAFLAWLKTLTGIDRLLYDPSYIGGGAQENMRDTNLWPHIDFNIHPRTGWHRRVNLLLYLNSRWAPTMGGRLILQAGPRTRKGMARIAPLFNRCVVFATGENTWHSVERVREMGSGRGRRSVSLYFYTPITPQKSIPAHSTLWAFPDFPKTIRQGATLTQKSLDAVNRALALRDIERAGYERRKQEHWTSPLPTRFRPGYRLTARDIQLMRAEISKRQKRLEHYWRYKRSPDLKAERLWRIARLMRQKNQDQTG